MEKIAVGMSGGVDSSVTAYLLKEKGYEVIGVTMCVYGQGEVTELPIAKEAAQVCEMLEIPHYVIDVRDIFKDKVIDNFIDEYQNGRTPNPCLMCNRYIKWGAILDFCDEHGIDKMATGHYACIVKMHNGRLSVKKSDYDRKDQSYVLYKLTQEQLARTIMPLGAYDKTEVRKIAEQIGLSVANKPDSEDICFIPDNDHSSFIERTTNEKSKPGDFIDREGQVLGKHSGIINYTIGQRKGLGIAIGTPIYVTSIDAAANQVVLDEHEALFHRGLVAENVNYMGLENIDRINCIGKIRYAHKGSSCFAYTDESGKLHVKFDDAQRAITPGQSIVLYDDKDNVLAGGEITAQED